MKTIDVSERIKEISLRLTKTLSITETKGEVNIAEDIYNIFSKMDYYKENPDDLEYVYVPDDELKRKSVLASLRGRKDDNNETIVLIGHLDTVGISDYGNLKDYANDPIELTKKFREIKDSLSDEVNKDIDSGEYIFGRGIFDMKTGDAIIISIIEEISKNLENFSGNLIFAAVCDEEVNSKGMLSVIPRLVEKRNQENWKYLAMLDTDYMASEYEDDENKYIYIGAVGKLMPSFFVVGKETHVGESFGGLDPNQIVAEITRKINMNTDYCDVVEGEATLPPVTLKQRDLKPEYTVQTAKTANVFFNYATHKSTPDQVMEKMIKAARIAFDRVIDDLNEEYRTFCTMINREYKELPWKSKVVSYNELYDQVKKEYDEDLDIKLEEYEAELLEDKTIDEREHSLKMVEYLYNLWSFRDPVIVVYYTPPYYPHIYVEGKNNKEKRLLESVINAVDSTESDYNLLYKKFFPAIADISYASAPKEESVIESLIDNMPGYGTKYKLPIKDMQDLDLPVLDIGSFGKDAHQFTERVHIDYSTKVAPVILYKTIMNLLGNEY